MNNAPVSLLNMHTPLIRVNPVKSLSKNKTRSLGILMDSKVSGRGDSPSLMVGLTAAKNSQEESKIEEFFFLALFRHDVFKSRYSLQL